MIHQHEGNCLDIPFGIIVQGCNAQGKMKSGIAKQIRALWPIVYTVYRQEYRKARKDSPSLPLGTISHAAVGPSKIVVNAITQEFYGRDQDVLYVSYDGLRKAFQALGDLITTNSVFGNLADLHGVHFPLIGCGLANGDWNIVSKIIDECLPDVEKHLWIYTPPVDEL